MMRGVKNLRKLSKKTVDQGEIKLSRYISAPAWLDMMSGADESMERLKVEWERIFCPLVSVPSPPVAIPDSESQARCRELFGADFLGVKEAAGPYGYSFSEKEIEERKAVRILDRNGVLLSEEKSWDLIRRCHGEAPDAFVLCIGIPVSVCEVHAVHSDVFYPSLCANPWFAEPEERTAWSDDKIPDPWFLLSKEVVPDSWNKSSAVQDDWLPKAHPHERFAKPQHIVYGDVLCEKATKGKVRLYCGDRWGRTLVRAAHGYLVNVRRDPDGLDVDRWSDNPGGSGGVPSLWTS